jgi:hypothetical protein
MKSGLDREFHQFLMFEALQKPSWIIKSDVPRLCRDCQVAYQSGCGDHCLHERHSVEFRQWKRSLHLFAS